MPGRLMAGHIPLEDVIGVRIPARQLEQVFLRDPERMK